MPKLSVYQQVIHKSKYARYLWDEQRRETWEETCGRYASFMANRFHLTDEVKTEIAKGIEDLRVLPSMRALMTAGKALERDLCAGFNCAYMPVDSLRSFDEAAYILMCGTGVGFSVERRHVDKLPPVEPHAAQDKVHIVVRDSKIGWAQAIRKWIGALWEGADPTYDVSQVRESGKPLKTFGGTASGPEPLVKFFNQSATIIKAARGRRLKRVEAHDLMCLIADVIVVGGVRRSALISLSDLNDEEMRDCKTDLWFQNHLGQMECKAPHRQLSNNSAVFENKPSVLDFMKEWSALIRSGSGERGIANRYAMRKQALKWGREDALSQDYGVNPCAEIILRNYQFCNLTAVCVREDDTFDSLKDKVRLATIMGTLQSAMSDFRYLRQSWRDNTEEEALLGVSFTGIMDHDVMSGRSGKPQLKKWLNELRDFSKTVNEEWAEKIGVNPSKSWTTVKPSGNSGELTNTASGIHARISPYYIRRLRLSTNDAVCTALVEAGVPHEPDLRAPDNTMVFEFPQRAPEGAETVPDRDAIAQLDLWMQYKKEWATHTVSCTVSVGQDEWLRVGSWVYDNFDDVTGISFLPRFDAMNEDNSPKFPQMPYEPCSKEEYERRLAEIPSSIDWDSIKEFTDLTEGSQSLA